MKVFITGSTAQALKSHINYEEECFIRIFKHREVGVKMRHSRLFFLTNFELFGYLTNILHFFMNFCVNLT